MRSLIVSICVLLSFSVFADNKGKQQFHYPSSFEVIPLNSPVKGSTAKFQLKLPVGFEVDKIKVKLVNAFDLKKVQKKFEDISVANSNELNVSVSKLPPGFYRLHVKVIDKKSRKEHDFKTKYHDYVRFVIDESLQVPIPDSKKNNATIKGIDSDNDGIRDDIQRFINETYANKPNTKLAAKQLMMAADARLINVTDPLSEEIYFGKWSQSYSCFSWVNPKAYEIEKKLRTMQLNTELRIRKSLQADQWGHGGGLSQAELDFQETYAGIGGPRDYSVFCDFNAQEEQ